tara:strand:- start:1434 stop:4937 length:3504 start_codon:yes stop_codon:yes gene_type:complete
MVKKITQDKVVQTDLWQNTIDSTKLLIEVVDKLDVSLKKVATDSKAALKGNSTQDFAGLKGADEEVKKVNKAFEDKIKLDKQRLVLEKQLEKARLSELKLQKDREKAFDRADKQEKIAIKNAQKLRKANIDSTNAYKKLTKQVNNAQARFKRLAAEFGVNSKQAQKANITFAQLDDRLRRINNTAKDGRRDVGRYGLAFREVGISLKSLFIAGGVVGVIRGIGRAFGDAFERVRSFDKELQNIAGVTGIARKDLVGLEKSIISVAGSSIRTSNEVAKLATTLFTLGNSEKAVKLLLKPVNDLSIALGATSEEAADFLGQTLNAFGKGAESGQEFADIIANVRTSTSLDFQRIKDALGFVAPTANALGLSLGEISAQIGVLQDNGIKAARAGRLLNSSFARLIKRGLSLDDALLKINNSQNKIVTATELFGAESFTLGLILADNTEKTANLANEFDNLSEGSLKTLTDSQLDSLDAKFKILDSTWEKFLLNIENGTGVFSKLTSNILTGTTKLIEGFRRLNQSTQENIAEDVSIRVRGIESQVSKTTKVIIDNAKKQRDIEVASFKEKLDANRVSQEDFNQAVGRSNKKLADSEKNARNDAILSQIAVEKNVRERLLQNNEFTDITIANASKVIEANKVSAIEELKVINNSRILSKTRKREEAANIEIQTARIEKLKTLIVVQEEEVEVVNESTESKKTNGEAVKELTGLINLQAKAVSDLSAQIREAKTEEDILGLSKKADAAKEELDRLQRIASSSIEEFDKQQLKLIEDQTERAIAKEKAKNDKIIALIRSNAKVKGTTEARLTMEQAEAIDRIEANQAAFRANEEIKRDRKLIKEKAAFSKAEFEQRRTGFKNEEAFEKEKEEQFKAIKIKALEEELDLLESYNRKEDDLREDQIKAELQSFHKLGEDKIKVEIDVVDILQALNDKYFADKLEKADEEIDSTKRRGEQLENLAAQGNANAAASLGQNQKDQAAAATKKEELLQKEKQAEFALSVIQTFNTELDNDKTVGQALATAGTTTVGLTALIGALPSFLEGTIDTGTSGTLDSNGGHVALLHDEERVVDQKNNKKMGGVSNDFAADTIQDFNNGLLTYNTPQLIVKEDRFDSSEKILSKFDTLEKSIVSAINNKETYLGSDIDTMKKLISQKYSKDGTRTTIKSKLRTRQ